MKPTTLDHLIAFLLSARSTKIYRKILWSRIHAREKGLSNAAFRQHIYRLRKRGVIETTGDTICIHRQNLKRFLVEKNSVLRNVYPAKTEKVLVSFDIPEEKKKVRDWLRNQLKYWDYEMIHKSLWLGGGPLPKEFKERLMLLGVNDHIKTFKILNKK